MKKIFSLAALAMAFMLAACTKGYTVSGTVEGAEDGDTVRIILATYDKFDTIHVTTVKDGRFHVSGQTDSTFYALVTYEGKDGKYISGSFFLENAQIKVAMSPNEVIPEISGTLINERNSELSRKAYAISAEFEEEFIGYNEDATPEEQQEIQEKYDALNAKMKALYKQFILENITNFAGQFYLAFYAPYFDADFILEQLSTIPEKDCTYVIRELREAIERADDDFAEPQAYLDFAAQTPDGVTLSVSDVAQGAKLLMIDFWASWCGPCRKEMPNVKAVYEKYHSQGFEVLGVSLDENAADWRAAIKELGMTWPQISDMKGWEAEGAQLYSVQAIPATVFIKDGKVVARDIRGEALDLKVEQLLAE